MKNRIEIKYPRGKIAAVLNKKLSSALNSSELTDIVGKPIVERIKFEAKRGSPLNDEGSFKDLSRLTVENRQRLEKFNKTTTVYKPDRSNLSFTGQLLDAVSYKKIIGKASAVVLIYFGGSRQMYNTGPRSKAKATKYNRTNEALARTLAEIGFKVFTKSGVENKTALIKQITNKIRSYLRKKLR